MRTDRTLWLTAVAALGAALVAFPFLPGSWPSPLQEGVELRPQDLLQLKMAAARVDVACARGDIRQFEAAVTPAHRQRLQRQLETVQRQLDPATLQALVTERSWTFAELMRQPVLAAEVRGARAAVAIDKDPGSGQAQVLEFEWDGQRLRLDGSHEAAVTAVDAVGPRRAGAATSPAALVREAVARRR